jgi:hypothetical protein
MRNEEVETLWVEAWDALLSLSKNTHDFVCMLPDGSVVGVEEGLGWLQQSVYEGYFVSVAPKHLFGRPGALLSRSERSGAERGVT